MVVVALHLSYCLTHIITFSPSRIKTSRGGKRLLGGLVVSNRVSSIVITPVSTKFPPKNSTINPPCSPDPDSATREIVGMGGLGDDRTSFWQFSDQLRSQTTVLSNLSIGGGDSIWNDSFVAKKRLEERRNFDQSQQIPKGNTGAGAGSLQEFDNNGKSVDAEFDGGSFGWKGVIGMKKSVHANNSNVGAAAGFGGGGVVKNGFFSKEIRQNRNFNDDFTGKGNTAASAKKKKNNNNNNNNNGGSGANDKSAVDKRFKTLPASEALPRNEAVGGYIFVCNNDTMPENLRRELFGLPPRYRDSVRAITPGLPLFLYNYSDHLLHGVFQASSFGGSNIDPTAWEDKKNAGESRFPAQVRVKKKKVCVALEEDSFRPILHHYDGPKFRLELSVPEALALLDKFEENIA